MQVGDAINAPSSVIAAVLDAAPELQDMAEESDIEIGSPAAAKTLTQVHLFSYFCKLTRKDCPALFPSSRCTLPLRRAFLVVEKM